MKLPRCLQPFAAIIDEVSDERRGGEANDGYWVYLRNGWWSPEEETHCVHHDTPAECVVALRTVERCYRDCCNSGCRATG